MTDQTGKKPGGKSAPVDDETKRRFREALDKKHAHAGTDVSDHAAHSKVGGPHDAEATGAQQMFRRKSG